MLNAGNNYLKYYLKLLVLKEEEENLLYQIKKKRFASKISVTEMDLGKKESPVLKKFNMNHNLNNRKIFNQIQSISDKINLNISQGKKNKMLDEILFSKPKEEKKLKSNKNIYNSNDNDINNNDNNNVNRYIGQNSLHKISSPGKKILNIRIKKDKGKSNKGNFSLLERKSFDKRKTEKPNKFLLPPIHQFKFNVKKIKLNINNSINKSEAEQMMNLYKEYEFQNKNKFVI